MLSSKDKKWIEEVLDKKLKEFLFRTITIEKSARGPGEVDKKVETYEAYIMDVLTDYIPRMEGALRGVQEDVEKQNNKINKIDDIGNLLGTISESITTMARFAIAINNNGLLEQMEKLALVDIEERKQIEG